MKNITVTVDDETYRRVRLKAAMEDTPVSALVRNFLTEIAKGESNADRLKRDETRLRDSIGAFRAGDRLDRDAIHARNA